MAGGWIQSPGGITSLDPTVIAYAPPGFPFLVGLAFGVLGRGDFAAILVSILAGTLMIPVVGWLGLRTFGRGAGAASAAFCALSGPHIAFSRMALTDVSFLLAWLVAIGQGQRFLEKPGPSRAVALGAAVGVAQLFKYNGWIAGAVVAVYAVLVTLRHLREQSAWLRLWGWGLLAAAVAAVVYWPWFRFVDGHGGYAALLSHQRGYLGGPGEWPSFALAQLRQDQALSGGPWWLVASGLAAALAMQAARGNVRGGPARFATVVATTMMVTALVLSLGLLFAAFICMCGFVAGIARPVSRAAGLVGIAWIVLAILTPFYHPYARLLLPFQAMSWLLSAGVFLALCERLESYVGGEASRSRGRGARALIAAAVVWILPTLLAFTAYWDRSRTIRELLEPSDSVRAACRRIAGIMPRDLESLRLYARPPVTFYLSSVVAPRAAADAREPARGRRFAVVGCDRRRDAPPGGRGPSPAGDHRSRALGAGPRGRHHDEPSDLARHRSDDGRDPRRRPLGAH